MMHGPVKAGRASAGSAAMPSARVRSIRTNGVRRNRCQNSRYIWGYIWGYRSFLNGRKPAENRDFVHLSTRRDYPRRWIAVLRSNRQISAKHKSCSSSISVCVEPGLRTIHVLPRQAINQPLFCKCSTARPISIRIASDLESFITGNLYANYRRSESCSAARSRL